RPLLSLNFGNTCIRITSLSDWIATAITSLHIDYTMRNKKIISFQYIFSGNCAIIKKESDAETSFSIVKPFKNGDKN
ncbi:TPA: hypothetical protein ACOIT1_001310, partial [Enterococcus faecalis]